MFENDRLEKEKKRESQTNDCSSELDSTDDVSDFLSMLDSHIENGTIQTPKKRKKRFVLKRSLS